MATLLIDIGNTALKAAWADGITLGKTFRYQGERMVDFIISLTRDSRPELIVLSSVRNFSAQSVERISKVCDRLLVLDGGLLNEKYSIPSHLTPDRAASIIASRYLFKSRGCTIFDFGATMTVDKIDSEGNYLGGNISLGCHTRFKSLHRYSKNIPLINLENEVPDLGNSLKTSLLSGVVSGMLFEINGYLSDNSENIAVFTGGDANYFAKRMKNCIFAVCNLVLMGLALIAFEYEKKD